MAIFSYDNEKFAIGSDLIYDADGKPLGFLAMCSSMLPKPLTCPPPNASLKYVAGTVLKTSIEAEQYAMAFVRLNWDAQKSRRPLKVGDKVACVSTNLRGKVAPLNGHTPSVGYTHVELEDGTFEDINSGQLVLLP